MIPIGELFSQKSGHFGLLENFMSNSSSACQIIYGDNSIAKLSDIQKKISVGYVENIAVGLQTWNPTIWEKRGNCLKHSSCKLTNSTFCSTSAKQDRKNPHKAVSSCARRALPEMVGMATTVGKQNPKTQHFAFLSVLGGINHGLQWPQSLNWLPFTVDVGVYLSSLPLLTMLCQADRIKTNWHYTVKVQNVPKNPGMPKMYQWNCLQRCPSVLITCFREKPVQIGFKSLKLAWQCGCLGLQNSTYDTPARIEKMVCMKQTAGLSDQSHFWVDLYHVQKNTWDLLKVTSFSDFPGGYSNLNPFNKRLQGLKSFTNYHHLFPERPECPRISLEWFFRCTHDYRKKNTVGAIPHSQKNRHFLCVTENTSVNRCFKGFETDTASILNKVSCWL